MARRLVPCLLVLSTLFAGCKWGTLGGDLGSLSKPTDVTVAAISSSQLVVSWTDTSSSEDGFTIERAPDSGGAAGAFTVAGSVSADIETFSDSSLDEATTYWYRVFAYDNDDADSSKAGPVAGQTRLSEPLNLQATAASATTVDLTWTDVSTKEDGYTVERADDNSSTPSSWTVLVEEGEDVTAYSDTTVSGGTTYWYRVFARSASFADSNYSSQESVTTP